MSRHKLVEAALRESEARYRTLVETSPDAITLTDLQGNVVFCNQQAARLHGYERPEEVIGLNAFDFIAPEEHSRAVENTQKTLQTGGVRDIPYTLLKRDGSRFPVELSASLVLDAQGEPKGFIAAVRDITERKQADEALIQLSSAIQQTADNVFITGRDGIIQYVNPAFEKLTGYTRQEAIGKTPRLLKSGRHGDEFYRQLWEAILAGETFRSQFVNRKKNGELYYEEKTITPVRNQNGEITHFVSTGKDITERVQAFQLLEQRVEESTHQAVQLYEQAEQQRRELEALYRADEHLYRHLRLDQVLQALVDVVIDILQADKASVQVWDPESQRLVLRAVRGYSQEMADILASYLPGDGISGKVFLTGEPVAVEDARFAPPPADHIAKMEGIRSVLSVPITIGDQIFGVFGMDYCRPRSFSEGDKRLFLALAQRAAVAIENARLYEQAEQVAVLEERQRLARDLHDSVTQSLYSLMLLSEAGRRFASSGDIANAGHYLSRVGETAQQTLKEMRLLVHEMRPLALRQVGLVEAIQARLDSVEKRSGIQASLIQEGQLNLPEQVVEQLFRIIQEALNNSLKHASSPLILVRITSQAGYVEVEITDKGLGFDPAGLANPGGFGMTSMRERAELIGGKLEIASSVGQGVTVKAKVPQP